MIIIHLSNLEDFASFLDRRVSNEIFFEFIKPEPEMNGLRVQLQFLGVMNNTNILFTTHLDFPKIKDKDAVVKKLSEIKLSNFELRIIHGTIRELYFSVS